MTLSPIPIIHPTATSNATPDPSVLDPSRLAEARVLMRGKFPRIIAFFLEDMPRYIGQIEESIRAGKADAVVSAAHTLKSSAMQMGARAVADIAKTIELEARELLKTRGDVSVLEPHLAPLREASTQTHTALSALIQNSSE